MRVLRAVEPAAEAPLVPEPRGEVHSVRLGTRWTTVRLEPEFKSVLDEICLAEGVSWNALCTEVDRSRGPGGNLTAALRSYALNYLRTRVPGFSAGHTDSVVRVSDLLGDMRNVAIRSDNRTVIGRREDNLDTVLRHPGFNLIFALWRALARADDIPAVEKFPFETLRAVGSVADMINITEVRSGDPREYRLERPAPVATLTPLPPGKLLRDLGNGAVGRSAREDYMHAKERAGPVLQTVVMAPIEGASNSRAYNRLFLPLREPGVGVTRLVVAFDWAGPEAPPRKPK